MFAAEPLRNWHPVYVLRPSTFVGKLMSKIVPTRTGDVHVFPPSPELTTMSWFSAGVLKFSKLTYTFPVGATVGYESWFRSHSLGAPKAAAEHAGLKPLISTRSVQV